MCNIKLIFDKLQRITAKQKLIVYFLVKCKNQINKIIAYSLVADHIFKKSGEELIIKHLSPFLKNCVDVGANTGEWSEMILENSNFSIQQIVILEPGKLAFAKLANKFSSDKRLILLNNGLAHINSNLSFNELNDAGETSSFVRFPNDGDGNNLIEVFKYDTLMDNLSIKYIDYLKIDCEGFDFNVLKGANDNIKNNKIGIIQFEYNTEWIEAGATLKAAYILLTQNGYSFFLLNKDGLKVYQPDYNGEFFGYSNFVAVSENWVDKIKTLILK